jgi:signal transduction histidine kinase
MSSENIFTSSHSADVFPINQQMLRRLIEINHILNTALLSPSLDIDELLPQIMDAAADITDAESASILLWRDRSQELVFRATGAQNALAQSIVGKAVPLDSIAGTIFREKRAVQIENVEQDPRHYNKVDEDLQFVTRSLLGVPLIVKNEVIGVLEVVNKRQLPWTADDQQALMLLANNAAVAIEVARNVLRLKRANEELKEIDKLKNDFISIASHELRTPLGIILGYASFLGDTASSPEQTEMIDKVTAGAQQLRQIIDGLVNLGHMRQQSDDLVLETIPLRQVFEALVGEAEMLNINHQHQFDVQPPPVNICTRVDAVRLGMALTNIVNNAVRFTPPKGHIRIFWQPHGDREGDIVIEDNGVGIADENLEKIFNDFYQVEHHLTRHHGGLGVGLTIAKAIVEAHDGSIRAESKGLGKGARFTVTLPVIACSQK